MAEDYDEKPPSIIIDNGSCCIKSGLEGEEGPRSVFHTILGEDNKYNKKMLNPGNKIFYIGKDAEDKYGILNFKTPMKRAIIKDWYIMEKIWGHIFTDELRVAPCDHNVLITQPIKNIKENKEKIVEIMFEIFGVPGLYLADSTILSLYSEGKSTGMVIDMGDGSTQFSPVVNEKLLEDKCERINIGGKDITKYMRKILNKKGYIFEKFSEKRIAREFKEKACYISLSSNEKVEPFEYELPDGNLVNIKEERTKAPEAFIFNPYLIFKEGKSIPQICYEIIQKCDKNLQKKLYNNIILSGGNSLFKGLPERFTQELKKLVDKSMKNEIKVIANKWRKYSTWIGGSILSQGQEFKNNLISKKEYKEYGSQIVHKKQ